MNRLLKGEAFAHTGFGIKSPKPDVHISYGITVYHDSLHFFSHLVSIIRQQ
ncbi:MAG: hypothetical protein LBJ00_07560 [Planctomycetaceae bacterium]|nr:hypothetical protein [Planctomycetaceae bacterium]